MKKMTIKTQKESEENREELIVEAKINPQMEHVEVSIADARSSIVDKFSSSPFNELNQVAELIWKVGTDAVLHANQQSHLGELEEKGRKISTALADAFGEQAEEFKELTDKLVTDMFDEEEGAMRQNIESYLGPEGILANVISDHIQGSDSVLAQTLGGIIGTESPFGVALNPEHEKGLVNIINNKVSETLTQEMDTRNEHSSLSKFFAELRTKMDEDGESRHEQLVVLARLLDPSHPQSPLKRLTDQTSLAVENSAMSVIRAEMKDGMNSFASKIEELTDFVKEEKAAQEARDALPKNTFDGLDFEHQLGHHIDLISNVQPLENEAKGHTVGALSGCKKGDFVVQYEPEHAMSGVSIVVEAKSDKSYTQKKALEEMQKAIENRGSQAGLFVMETQCAKPNFPVLRRFGKIVLFQWDADQPAAIEKLSAALSLTLALAEKDAPMNAANKEKITDVADRIEKELERIVKMDKFTGNIVRDAEKIQGELRTMKKKLCIAVEHTQEALEALGLERATTEDATDIL
jgi:hypothetical protein